MCQEKNYTAPGRVSATGVWGSVLLLHPEGGVCSGYRGVYTPQADTPPGTATAAENYNTHNPTAYMNALFLLKII